MIAGQLHLWFQLQFHIYVTPFEDPLHPWLQYHLCLILDHEGGSTPSMAPDQYLCCTFWGSTPSPAPVQCTFCIGLCGKESIPCLAPTPEPYLCYTFEGPLHLYLQSYLCLTLDHRDQLHLQFWIHICVVPFEYPLFLQLQSHLCFTLDYVGGQLHLQIHISVVHLRVHSISGSSPIYISP